MLVCSPEGRTWAEAVEWSNWHGGGGSRKLHNELIPSDVIGEEEMWKSVLFLRNVFINGNQLQSCCYASNKFYVFFLMLG
jgi:hypothetical protein